MALSPAEIEAIYYKSLSQTVNEALIRLLFGGYLTAHEDCSKFPKQEARDLLPIYRWTQIRADLLGLPARFDKILASSERYHTRLTTGGIILTAHSVEAPGELPREAEYRREYACTSQTDMWDDTDGEYIYAILAHAPDPSENRQPLFADILFPDRHYNGLVHSIKLFEKFPALISELRISKIEETKTQPIVTPKKHITKQNDGTNLA